MHTMFQDVQDILHAVSGRLFRLQVLEVLLLVPGEIYQIYQQECLYYGQ